MTPAAKLRELLATRPVCPGLVELVRWWLTSAELVPQVLDQLENDTCSRHAGKAHGAEAEELRRGIERILKRGYGSAEALHADLQRMLDEVSARDSLAYLEDRDAAIDVLKQEVRELEQQRDAHRASLNRIADRLRVVHEDDKIERAVEALRAERDQLMAYIDEAKRVAGAERVAGEPLAAFIERAIGEYAEACDLAQRHKDEVERLRAASVALAGDAFEHGLWRPCSGCHETDEGHPTGPYSETFRCNLGSGCHECGGLGATWEPFVEVIAGADLMVGDRSTPVTVVGRTADGLVTLKVDDPATIALLKDGTQPVSLGYLLGEPAAAKEPSDV